MKTIATTERIERRANEIGKNNMKKALIIASTAGFVRAFLMHDIEMLQNRGFEVHCATNSDGMVMFDPKSFFSEKGVLLHQIDFSSTSPLSRSTMEAMKQLKQLKKEHKFQFVHCHTPIVGAVVRYLFRKDRKKGCVVAYTSHGLAYTKNSGFKSHAKYESVERICAHWCDAIITINQEDYDTVKKYSCPHKYHINGVGIDVSKYRNVDVDRTEYRRSIGVSEQDIMVLSVGELSKRKNQQIIIRALAELSNPRYVFVICGKAMSGKGTYNELVELSKSLGVRTIFLGFRKDIPEITHCAEMLVIPSTREGLGLAGVQALAAGVPVIGSRVQGIKDYVIDGETGYLCDANSPDEFAEKIKILSDSSEADRMRQNCMRKAEEFDQKVSFSQMERIYSDLLGEKNVEY